MFKEISSFIVFLGQLSAVIFLIVFFIRIMGKNHLKETSPLDFIYLLLIGSIAWDMLLEPKYNLIHIFVALSVVSLIIFLIDYLTYKFKPFEKVFIGKPKVIINNGVLDEEILKSQRLSRKELEAMLRSQGAFNIETINLAVLEVDGTISVKSRER